MLLQALYDYAHSRNLLDDLAFAPKTVRWIINLDADGNMIGTGPVDTSEDRMRGKDFSCPRTSRNKNAGGVAEFLAEGLPALFGQDGDLKKLNKLSDSKRKIREDNNAAKRLAFRALLASCAQVIPSVKACVRFLDGVHDIPSFLSIKDDTWWLESAAGESVKLGADNFSFRVGGNLLLEDPNVRDW